MNITCLIIDDEQLARDLLKEYIENTPEVNHSWRS
jgi:chemotaxis response regulator CheB